MIKKPEDADSCGISDSLTLYSPKVFGVKFSLRGIGRIFLT